MQVTFSNFRTQFLSIVLSQLRFRNLAKVIRSAGLALHCIIIAISSPPLPPPPPLPLPLPLPLLFLQCPSSLSLSLCPCAAALPCVCACAALPLPLPLPLPLLFFAMPLFVLGTLDARATLGTAFCLAAQNLIRL